MSVKSKDFQDSKNSSKPQAKPESQTLAES